MENGINTMSAILKDERPEKPLPKKSKIINVDEEKANSLYKDFEKMWSSIMDGVRQNNLNRQHGAYLTLLERYREDILDEK
jgi:hypothetical protein